MNNHNYINDATVKMMLSKLDNETYGHSIRVQLIVTMICDTILRYNSEMLTKKSCELIVESSILHDIGKIYVGNRIITKKERLNSVEIRLIRYHTLAGTDYILRSLWISNKEIMNTIINIVLYHHERVDGTGYPYGLVEFEIPLESQIVALADCIDALISKRSYKESISRAKAFDIISNGGCGKFSDFMIDTMYKLDTDEIDKIYNMRCCE